MGRQATSGDQGRAGVRSAGSIIPVTPSEYNRGGEHCLVAPERSIFGDLMTPTIHPVTPGSSRRQHRLLRERTTLRVVLAAIVAAGLGVALLYVSGRTEWWSGKLAGQRLVADLGGLLVAAVAISLLWEFAGKRKFADEILDKVGVASDIDRAGIVRVTDQYLKEVEWDSYFQRVQKLDVVVAYGRTWRQTHLEQLRAIAGRADARVRVILPDPEDTQSLAVLANRFARTPAQLRDDILEAANEFLALRTYGPATIRLYFRRGDQVFSCYRLDQTSVVTLYSHSRTRRPVPTIVCRSGGTLYDFIRQEIEAMLSNSREIRDVAGLGTIHKREGTS